jgi:hypothetical protein
LSFVKNGYVYGSAARELAAPVRREPETVEDDSDLPFTMSEEG